MAKPDISWGWAFLKAERDDLNDSSAWPEIVGIVDHLLAREQRIHVEKLLTGITRAAATLHDRERLLDAVLRGLMIVQSAEFREVQGARDRLDMLNDDIAIKMCDLAAAIERRDAVSHEHDLHAPEAVSLFGAIDAGFDATDAETRYRGREHTWPKLEALLGQYVGNYWPTVPDCLRGLAERQNSAGNASYRALQQSMMGYDVNRVRAIGGLLTIVDQTAAQLPAQPLKPAAIAAALHALGHDDITAENVRKNPARARRQKAENQP